MWHVDTGLCSEDLLEVADENYPWAYSRSVDMIWKKKECKGVVEGKNSPKKQVKYVSEEKGKSKWGSWGKYSIYSGKGVKERGNTP